MHGIFKDTMQQKETLIDLLLIEYYLKFCIYIYIYICYIIFFIMFFKLQFSP